MRKKSGRKAAQTFKATIDRLEEFTDEVVKADLSDQAITWAYEAALLKTYVAFERLMLECLVTAINNDTKTIADISGVKFPKHLSDEVCEYLVTGGGYFDFKGGRGGLIKEIKKYVPDDHWLLETVREQLPKKQFDIMVSLRNFAAHESLPSKRKAAEDVGLKKIKSAGAWLKCQGRFTTMTKALIKLADAIEDRAPF